MDDLKVEVEGEMLSRKHDDQASSPGESKRLDYYRRQRPYDIVPNYVDEKGPKTTVYRFWSVLDGLSQEVLGRLVARIDSPGSIKIELQFAAASSKRVVKFNNSPEERYSIHEAAGELWKAVYPIKSVWWRFMRGFVHCCDGSIRVVESLAPVVLIGIAVAFVFGVIPFLWEARDVIQDIVLQWLEEVRDQGSSQVIPPSIPLE